MIRYIKTFLFSSIILCVSINSTKNLNDATQKSDDQFILETESANNELMQLSVHHETIQNIFDDLSHSPNSYENLPSILFLNLLKLISTQDFAPQNYQKKNIIQKIKQLRNEMKFILDYFQDNINIVKSDTLFTIIKDMLFTLQTPIQAYELENAYYKAENENQKLTIITAIQIYLLTYLTPKLNEISENISQTTKGILSIIENNEILNNEETEKIHLKLYEIKAFVYDNLLADHNIKDIPLTELMDLTYSSSYEMKNSKISIKKYKQLDDDKKIENELRKNWNQLAKYIDIKHEITPLFTLMLHNNRLQFLEMQNEANKQDTKYFSNLLQGSSVIISTLVLAALIVSASLAANGFDTAITQMISFVVLGCYVVTQTFTIIVNYNNTAKLLHKVPFFNKLID